MYKYLQKSAGKNVFHSLLLIASSAISVGTAITLSLMTDQLAKGSFRGFLFWISIEISLFLLTLVMAYVTSVNQTRLVQEMSLSIREDYIKSVLNHSFSDFQAKSLGEHLSILNNDIKIIEESGFNSFYRMITTISTTVFSLIALISFDLRIVLLTIVLTVALTYLPRPFSKKIESLMGTFSKANESFVSGISDQLSGYSALYYAGKKNQLMRQIKKITDYFVKEQVAFAKKSTLIEVIMAMFSIFGQVSVLLVTGFLISAGQLTIGTIASVGQISGNIFNSLSTLNNLRVSLSSVKPLFAKFDNEKNEGIEENNTSISEFKFLKGSKIGYSFDGKKVFKELDFQFEKGKNYAVIGESGSGKSTLIQMILGNYKNYEGMLVYNDFELAKIDENSLIRKIAYVGSHTHIYQDTLRNNLTLWDDSIYTDRLEEVLEKVNLSSLFVRLDEDISETMLSEGQKQRIGIARAYLKNNDIIIMDEATANLDFLNAKSIEDDLLNDENMTYITVTHHLREEVKNKFKDVVLLGN